MATEIFSHALKGNSVYDSLTVSLSSDEDISVHLMKPLGLEITEAFSTISPIVVFEFTDGNGDFVNHFKPSPAKKFFLDIGRDILSMTRVELCLSSVVMLNRTFGSAKQIAFKMTFVHAGWNDMINKRKNRGWADKLYSEIVEEVAGECGFSKMDVVPTTGGPEVFIQPYWNNFDTIDYISERCATENGGHMEYGTRINGTFFFKSIGDMIAEQKAAAIGGQIVSFKMESQPSEIDRAELYKKNKDAPTYFAQFVGEQRYMEAVTGGGGGIEAMYFDSTSGSYEKTTTKYSELEVTQLCDWAGVQSEHEVTGYRMYGGRDPEVVVEAQNRLLDIVDSISKFEIITEGCLSIGLTDMVELIIPVPIDVPSIIPHNIIYSGFYLISGAKHRFDFKNSNMTTTLSLMREGFDGKELTGYVKSIKGKFV